MNVRQFPNSLHWIALIFAAVTHFYFATQRWDSEALIAHEFRQTQTAIIARYIDQQDNFGLRYETPILGKPWEFPLEVPIYQWLVVGVARLAGVTHVSAARGISLASFYLMLGAIWMLLGACRMERPWRCWVLVMTLCSPVYLFYSRSFLIDPLATAASAWFLASFVRQMDTRRWRWMGLTVLTASLAALIKSVVFFVWLVPAALWGAWVWGAQLWRGRDWKQATCTALWGAGPMVIPLGLLKWWVDRTDAIKAAHSSAWIFTSEALAKGNFGTFDLSSRLSQTTWNDLFARWNEVMVRPEPVVAILVLGFLGAGRWRLHLVAAAALFMTGQLVFPFAYAYQDYYFYAGAVFLAAAFGFGAVGWLQWARVPRLVRLAVAVVPCALLLRSYQETYHHQLMADDNRDWVLTKSLRELLPEHAVLVVAGNDWSAMIPYFAHKKALMIRNGLEYDRSYLAQAFHDLQGEDVCAFVALGSLRENQQLLGFAQRSFRLDRKPTFQAEGVDVYVARRYREAFVRSMEEDAERYPGATVSALSADGEDSGDEDGRLERTDFALGEAERRFPLFEGRFLGALSPFPLVDAQVADGPAVVVHPPLQMWFNPDLRAGTAHWSVRIYSAAYENREPWDRTDGVLFSIWVENSRGERKQLFRRFLDPANRTEDRGWQEFRVPYALNPEDGLVFVTDPGVSDSFDWAQCRRIGFEAL